jgi:hypothetical protein
VKEFAERWLSRTPAAGLSLWEAIWRRATVRVVRVHGHRLLLRAPLVTAWQGDPEFEDKVQTIRRWWQAYGQGTSASAHPAVTD